MDENKTIGFFLLKKINDEYPFYLDYFAIYNRRLDDASDNPRKQYFNREMREVLSTYKEIIINENDKIEVDCGLIFRSMMEQ